MAVATAATIKTQLEAGSYPDDTLNSNNIFDYPQYERRRKYPSCDIETIQPRSSEETKRATTYTTAFVISYYVRNLGARTDEVAGQKSVEDVILTQLESMVLDDHKLVFESKTWQRQQVQRTSDHPAYTVSKLRVTVRHVSPTTATADGVLIFDLSESTVDSAPGADYTYTSVFDVDIDEGYRGIAEQVATAPDGDHVPIYYAGMFSGRFICHIPIKAADLGTTGEKINKLMTVNTNGEKPIVGFAYTNKTNDSTPSTINEAVQIEVDSVSRLYRHNDTTVYRLIGTITKPSSVTVT